MKHSKGKQPFCYQVLIIGDKLAQHSVIPESFIVAVKSLKTNRAIN
jgi:hypothetical protein